MIERYRFSVLGACNAIHGSYCGSGDGLTDDALDTYIAWLEHCIATWQPSSPRWQAHDDAVLALARAALDEARQDRQERHDYAAKRAAEAAALAAARAE